MNNYDIQREDFNRDVKEERLYRKQHGFSRRVTPFPPHPFRSDAERDVELEAIKKLRVIKY